MVAAFVLAAVLWTSSATGPIAALEKSGSRLGVAALDLASGAQSTHRPNERFRLCSTFKFLAAAAVLKKVDDGKDQLDRFITYGKDDLLEHAPVTREHVSAGGMKLGALCAAALQQSDNTAGNLLLRELDGPDGLTRFLRSIGDSVTRCDRLEPELNLGGPGDERDTTTPAAMVADLQRLLTGPVLSEKSRAQLRDWIAANTTGDGMIRAGVPADWKVGDKTGRSHDGEVNDIAILQPPGRAPIFLAVYTFQPKAKNEVQKQLIAQITGLVVDSFARVR